MSPTNKETSNTIKHGQLMKKNTNDETLMLHGKGDLGFGEMYLTKEYAFIRTLEDVYRCTGIPLIKPYNCAAHCYHTGILFEEIARLEEVYNIPSQATQWVYRHDIVESVTGDLPYPVKHHSKTTEIMWDSIEMEIATAFGISRYMDTEARVLFSNQEWKLFRAVDLYELALFCYEDYMRGNRHPVFIQVLRNGIFGSAKYGFKTLTKGAEAMRLACELEI